MYSVIVVMVYVYISISIHPFVYVSHGMYMHHIMLYVAYYVSVIYMPVEVHMILCSVVCILCVI